MTLLESSTATRRRASRRVRCLSTPRPATPLCGASTISTAQHHILLASHRLDKLAESCSSIAERDDSWAPGPPRVASMSG